MSYKVIDLFCGAGGLSAGFMYGKQGTDFVGVLAIDNNKYACETYNANFAGNHCISVNIEEWLQQQDSIPQADIVIGGPPCQGFSLLNKNREGDQRRALWEPYMDIVAASGAKMFIMENVPGLLKSDEFQDIENKSETMGFTLQKGVLNTADYGVPQTRQRAIVVGFNLKYFDREKLPTFPPAPTHRGPKSNANLPLWNDVRSVISDLEPPKGTEIRDVAAPYNLHFGRKPTEISMKRYRVVPPGGNRFDLMANAPEITPKCWLNKPSGGTDLFGRLWWDRPSVTIRTEFFKPEKGRYLHPDQHRPITHREAARIMTFPDDFQFCGTKIEIAKQIGNAVPVAFAAHIAQYAEQALRATSTELGIAAA
ncbi:DNA cytosine methyltransferase [Grimontia hollisae]|uniref:DNA cytosine methyltransferase n=1 Tax=Grimontia hollisae TaxID=673 RepID=UPI000E0F8E01|nr:DNA cytosine methyltransferase [Grimontia hollisae]